MVGLIMKMLHSFSPRLAARNLVGPMATLIFMHADLVVVQFVLLVVLFVIVQLLKNLLWIAVLVFVLKKALRRQLIFQVQK